MSDALAKAGLDAVALKPAEHDIAAIPVVSPGAVTIDYEGREHLPTPEVLERLAGEASVRVTAPVRADGFDPLGEDYLYDDIPPEVGLVLVAGNPAYLDDTERERAVAPRLRAARERYPDAWVGTESVERVALAVGGPQFELLGPDTLGDLRALRQAGVEAELAVYAPVVLSADPDEILDAVGAFAARRRAVRRRLPEGAATDSTATGRAREVLLDACAEYALVGGVETVREKVRELEAAGADTVVGYPARGL